MARELIWLEDRSFAAWACNACRWITLNPNPASPGKTSEKVLGAFNLHDRAKFPRTLCPEAKKVRPATNKPPDAPTYPASG
jgi:hypothetical protein